MKRTQVSLDLDTIPAVFHNWLRGATVFDSSSSPDAKVYYLEKGTGYFLIRSQGHPEKGSGYDGVSL